MREQVELLEYHSHFLTEFVNVCLRIRDIRSLKIDVSAGRSFQQVHAAQLRPFGEYVLHNLLIDMRGQFSILCNTVFMKFAFV